MKIFKKALSATLVLLLLCNLFLPAYASGAGTTAGIPTICVDGIATKTLYLNPGTADEKQVFYPTNDTLNNAVKPLILPLCRVLIDRNWDAFSDKLIPAALGILEPIACNPDGTAKYNAGIKFDWSLPPNYNFTQTLTFYYDWRMDPMDIAVSLNDYIQFVKQQTGSKKVNLLPTSMGGNIASAYLELYGFQDINAVVMRSSAFQGVSLVGELFNKRFGFNKTAVLGYINELMKDDEQSNKIRLLVSVLDLTGIVDWLLPVLNDFIDSQKDRVYDEAVIKIFGYMPGMWALVPDAYYETAKDAILDPVANAQLIQKIDAYHYGVQARIGNLLKDAVKDGVKVGVIGGYDLYGCPITAKPFTQTDFLIDTAYTSGGATCAPVGGTLGEGYTQAVYCGHNHISSDNILDASTCMFPESTWFVKGMVHTQYNYDYDRLVNWIINFEGQPTVFDNPDYPQFLQLDKASNTLGPLDGSSVNTKEKTWIQKLMDVVLLVKQLST